MTAKRNLIVTMLGKKGSGKTTLVKAMLDEFPRVLIVDTNREYADSVDVTFSELPEALDYLKNVARQPADQPFSAAYVPEDIPDDALDFLRVAYTLENFVLVLDEAHMYCRASVIPQPIMMLVRLGRHRAISQIYVSQRPSTIPRDMTAQSDLIVSFQQHEGRDIDYMTRLFGRDADSLKRLKPYTVEVFGTAEALESLPLAVEKQRSKKAVDAQINLL